MNQLSSSDQWQPNRADEDHGLDLSQVGFSATPLPPAVPESSSQAEPPPQTGPAANEPPRIASQQSLPVARAIARPVARATGSVSGQSGAANTQPGAARTSNTPRPQSESLRPFGHRLRQSCLRPRHRGPVSFFASVLIHAVVFVLLGLIVSVPEVVERPRPLLASFIESRGSLEQGTTGSATSSLVEAGAESATESLPGVSLELIEKHSPNPSTLMIETQLFEASESVPGHSAGGHSPGSTDSDRSTRPGALAGRTGDLKAELLQRSGGTLESEQAVRRGLRWLALHQRQDGSWHFNHDLGPCAGQCTHAGTEPSTTGATGLALLCFLGAGETHVKGEYRDEVQRGLEYLKKRMIRSKFGGDLQEGTMYAQAIATLALCEAYAMTGDKSLVGYGQEAVNFIVNAQHEHGGGWRYTPGQPGDMTVTGWQLMALKSARLAALQVPETTLERAARFLDSLASDEGARYGYQNTSSGKTTTSVGLLCRMQFGWPRIAAPLQRGVSYLASEGPSQNDMYYNYYATQVLHHWGGAQWYAWNNQLRDYLIATQAQQGHEAGSWYFEDAHRSGQKGGRLFNTCMAVMTLEVYYRYLPIYGEL